MALRRVGAIELPAHVKPGGFDHAAVHTGRQLLYVAHTANDAVDVIDCKTDRYLLTIPGLPAVAGDRYRNRPVLQKRGKVFGLTERIASV